jgi:glycosyltransferase involved in cell wall biosynthesis
MNKVISKRILTGGTRLKKRQKTNPLFSIITVVLNRDQHIEKTIKSVLLQKFKNFEYIIIDGGSTDKTIDIVKKYSRKISYWSSEKDRGIYDAFNKGIKQARGKYIGIINSDDLYAKNALKIISKYINKNPKLDFIFGSVKKHWGILHGYNPKKIKYSWGFYTSHSTGFFIKRSSAKKVGLYNTKYKYHADYDYFYRMIVKNKMKGTATKKNELIGIFRRGGFSSTVHYRKLLIEQWKIRFQNGQNFILILIIACYQIIKHHKRFFS